VTERADSVTRPRPAGQGLVRSVASGVRALLVRSRVIVGVVLIAGGVGWAIARGLPYYGVSPTHLAYDLDQPPWLLILVSGWLWYRSRRR
jgi:hypothetical protein